MRLADLVHAWRTSDRRPVGESPLFPPGSMRAFGWLLQVLGLILAGAALGVGLIYGQVRLELALLAVGGVAFVTGRLIGRP